MILLFVVWIITFIVALPYGFVISKLLHYLVKEKNNTGIIEYFFLGIVGITSLVCCINYFYPINKIILGAISTGGILILIYYWKDISLLKSNIHNFLFNLTFSQLVVFFFLLLGVCLYSLSTPFNYDMDLYHMQYMQWISEYKIIPGLGNLHGRFAFNSSSLLFSSLFYNIRSFFYIFPLNEMIALFLLFTIFRNWNKRGKEINVMCLLIYVFSLVFFGCFLSSTSTDLGANFLVLYLFLYVRDKYENMTVFDIIFVLLVSLFCITSKLSCTFIILLPLYLIFNYHKLTFTLRNLSICISICFIILLPWVIRYVVISGYLVYPFDRIDLFDFDWKIPINKVIREKNDAYWWARNNKISYDEAMQMNFIKWFPIWFKNLNLSSTVIFLLAFVSPLILLFSYIFRKSQDKFIFISGGIGFIGTLYLILTAPDLRFCFSFVFLAAFVPWLGLSQSRKWIQKTSIIFTYIIIFFLGIYLLKISLGQLELHQLYTDKSLARVIVHPQEYGLRRPQLVFKSYNTNNIQTFYYPEKGDQCYDHYLPCSPYPNSNLHFRGDKIEDGFIIKQE